MITEALRPRARSWIVDEEVVHLVDVEVGDVHVPPGVELATEITEEITGPVRLRAGPQPGCRVVKEDIVAAVSIEARDEDTPAGRPLSTNHIRVSATIPNDGACR